jgi:superfamily II DNA or RNA helicase
MMQDAGMQDSPASNRPSSAVPAAPPEPAEPFIPPPPETATDLIIWAKTHGVAERLDDMFVDGRGAGGGYHGSYWPGRVGEALTYREVLVDTGAKAGHWRRYFGIADDARAFLHRMAKGVATYERTRAWMDANGRDPASEALAALLVRLREESQALLVARVRPARPPGTYRPTGITVLSSPVPALRYGERALSVADEFARHATIEVSLALLSWNEGGLRWTLLRDGSRQETNAVPPHYTEAAVEGMIDFLRDPRRVQEHDELTELLTTPTWRFVIGDLDRRLASLAAEATSSVGGRGEGAPSARREKRVGFRLRVNGDGDLDVDPVLQKRQKDGTFSKGSRTDWHNLGLRSDLTARDQDVYRAYADRFTQSSPWGRRSVGQIYRILGALIDHPVVLLDGQRGDVRPDIRQGRLRLRFATVPDGGLTPQFELLGHTLLPSEIAPAVRDERHLIHLVRPEGQSPQVLLATLSPSAAAIVRALALAPGRFPVDAHDALATRLESLQETMDIEFPSQWTRTIAPADGRPLVRLELLASGALQVRLAIRPVTLGPVFPPGEGPTLVLEGQGKDRHGARRDSQAERKTAHALAERLDLSSAAETEAWCWRVNEGDPALHVVSTLKEMGDTVVVEWADDAQLFSLGAVNRGSMRMQVADRRDWFAVEGGAEVKVDNGREIVPLATLFSAIRDGRRYVAVGARGFVRIEDTLREALAQAEGVFFEHRGGWQVSAVGSDSLMGLVEQQAQVKASAAFSALRKRMQEGAAEMPRLTPAMAATLRPYQHAGVTWMTRLAHWGAGVILADEMGLGKTVQTLAVLSHRAATGPALVVAPTSVLPNWFTEARRFAPELTVRGFRGPERAAITTGATRLGPGDVLVTSYAIATMEAEALAKLTFGTLVIDEAQAVKNATTERAKALLDLNAGWRLGLTGTPIENRLGELWSIFRVLSPGLLGSWEQFRARYAVPIEKFGDDSRRKALAALLRPFVLRRTKAEVAPELPARTEIVRSVRLSAEEQGLYEELRIATLVEIAQAKKNPDRDAQSMRFVLLAALTRLRQLCCHPRLVYPNTVAGSSKANYLLELLEELREGDHKALVFSQFRSFLDLLAPRLRQRGVRVLVLDGTTPSDVRERRVAAFQAGEADAFLISLKAGGFGLNLTVADTVVHMDPWWNPAVEDQATARAHRIGQYRPVTAIRLVARGTIEESVLGLHATKRALATSILEGTEIAASLDTEQLVELIQRGFEPNANANPQG